MGTAANGCPPPRGRLDGLSGKEQGGLRHRTADGGCPYMEIGYTGVSVFLAGLKNGKPDTLTFAFSRIASIVISICNGVPGFEYSVSRLAKAIIFFSVGDHVVVVTFPTCFSPENTGTATRDA